MDNGAVAGWIQALRTNPESDWPVLFRQAVERSDEPATVERDFRRAQFLVRETRKVEALRTDLQVAIRNAIGEAGRAAQLAGTLAGIAGDGTYDTAFVTNPTGAADLGSDLAVAAHRLRASLRVAAELAGE
jgi:hypothetical protein